MRHFSASNEIFLYFFPNLGCTFLKTGIPIAKSKFKRMEQAKPLLQGIDTVIVRVKDIKASKKWYEEKLGLRSLWDDPVSELAVLDTKSPTSLTLWQTAQKISINKETASYPIFRTPDAASLRQELLNRQVIAGDVITDHLVSYFFFYDPDGNILEACQVHQ